MNSTQDSRSTDIQPLIELCQANLWRGGRRILEGLDFKLLPGRNYALTGANGAGKSSFLKLLRGELWPEQDFTGQARRIYRIDGQESQSPIGLKERIGILGAEDRDLYLRREWNFKVFDVVASGFNDAVKLNIELTQAMAGRVNEVLNSLGINGLSTRGMLELSQGQTVKVLLARALVNRPVLLILDEALDGLDRKSRQDILAILHNLADFGTGIFYSTHRAANLPEFITDILHIKDGRLVELGSPKPRPAKPGSRGIRLNAVEPALGDDNYLVRVAGADVYLSGRKILENINFTLRAGENWAVLGENGAGKSTFLKLLHGDLRPHVESGGIERFPDQDISNIWDLKARLGYVSWDFQASQYFDLTGREIAASGFFSSIGLYQQVTPEQFAIAEAALARLGVFDLARVEASRMSYGQLRRVLLARALVNSPRVLLLDEPFGGLDPQSRQNMLDILDDLAACGVGLVMATHHLSELPKCVRYVLELKNGKSKVMKLI